MSDIEKLRAALAKIAEEASAAARGDEYPPTTTGQRKLPHRPLSATELEARAAEFNRSGRRCFVDGHSANGINRASAVKMSMIVIHLLLI